VSFGCIMEELGGYARSTCLAVAQRRSPGWQGLWLGRVGKRCTASLDLGDFMVVAMQMIHLTARAAFCCCYKVDLTNPITCHFMGRRVSVNSCWGLHYVLAWHGSRRRISTRHVRGISSTVGAGRAVNSLVGKARRECRHFGPRGYVLVKGLTMACEAQPDAPQRVMSQRLHNNRSHQLNPNKKSRGF
jgi:hypothetical protein